MTGQSKLRDRVAIITGASSGIGRATALAFAREGATTVLASRSREKLNQVADQIRAINGRVLVIPTDVSSREQVNDLIDEASRELGRIDILLNNAGSAHVGPIEDVRFTQDLDKMLSVDFYGAVYGTQAVLPIMKRQGTGHIINMSSVVGYKAFPMFGGYSITMHAIKAFSDALRQELHGTGIIVTTVHPALTRTALFDEVSPADMPPPFRWMIPLTPESVAAGIVGAVHNKRARVVLPFAPRLMILSDALSARSGDLTVRRLSNPRFARLIGMYRSRRADASSLEETLGDTVKVSGTGL